MKIDSVSYAVASKVVKTFAMNVSRIRGNATANGWLHVFDLKAVPASATGVVPKRSYPVYATAPFDVLLDESELDFVNGCVMALSSVQGAYTALASTMDLFVTGTSAYNDTGETSVGDYTTGTATVNATGILSVRRLEFTALTAYGASLYAKMFNTFPNAGIVPFWQGELLNNTSKDFWFNLPNATVYVLIDTTPGVAAGTYVGTNFAIKLTVT